MYIASGETCIIWRCCYNCKEHVPLKMMQENCLVLDPMLCAKKKLWLWHKDRVGVRRLTKKQEKHRQTSWLVITQTVVTLLTLILRQDGSQTEWCKSWTAATGALMMIASMWDLLSEVTNASTHHSFTKLVFLTLEKPNHWHLLVRSPGCVTDRENNYDCKVQ